MTALFGASLAGLVLVPVNPLLRADQAIYFCVTVMRVLVTLAGRLAALSQLLRDMPELQVVLLWRAPACAAPPAAPPLLAWDDCMRGQGEPRERHRRIDSDVAALLYNSGSCGQPNGVVLSHHNLLAGAHSVMRYLDNSATDRLLTVLPLSFGYGFSQLTTALACGASVVLMNHLLLRDIVETVARERITGLAAVPPWWI